MKIFLLRSNESWICDRLINEWEEHNTDQITKNPVEADVIWLLAGWCWNQLPIDLLKYKKVVITIHHIVPEKFDQQKYQEFLFRDQFIDAYHVPCKKTRDQISRLTSKPITNIPFWVNQNIWYDKKSQQTVLKEKYNLSKTSFLIGSFQRDTEGSDLISPKLEKGPDLFCDMVETLYEENRDIQVVLAGWRRQYVINRLTQKEIPYRYFELPSFEVINDLYNCLDLYIVSARYEGGPQSIAECSITKTPIISTNVGLASEILSSESLYQIGEELGTPNVEAAFENVQQYLMPQGFDKFHKFFSKVK